MPQKNPIGQPLSQWGKSGRVIGVLKNFHLQSLHRTIEPLLAYFDAQHRSNLVARIQAGQTLQALAVLRQAAKAVNPTYAPRSLMMHTNGSTKVKPLFRNWRPIWPD